MLRPALSIGPHAIAAPRDVLPLDYLTASKLQASRFPRHAHNGADDMHAHATIKPVPCAVQATGATGAVPSLLQGIGGLVNNALKSVKQVVTPPLSVPLQTSGTIVRLAGMCPNSGCPVPASAVIAAP